MYIALEINPLRDINYSQEEFCYKCNKLRHKSFLRRLHRNMFYCIKPCKKIYKWRGVIRSCNKCGVRKYTSNLIRIGYKKYACRNHPSFTNYNY